MITLDSDWKIQPNPAVNSVFIHFDKRRSSEISIRIYTVTGRLMKQVLVTELTNEIEFNLSNFPSGIYIVELDDGHLRSSKTLIVE